MIDFRTRTIKATRSKTAATRQRIIDGGAPECMACGDTGTIEIHPARIGEHSARGVRADLEAGNLSLCVCPMGDFWKTMLDDSPANLKQ